MLASAAIYFHLSMGKWHVQPSAGHTPSRMMRWECGEWNEQQTRQFRSSQVKKKLMPYLFSYISNMAIKFCVCFHFSVSVCIFYSSSWLWYSDARDEKMRAKEIDRSTSGSFRRRRRCFVKHETVFVCGKNGANETTAVSYVSWDCHTFCVNEIIVLYIEHTATSQVNTNVNSQHSGPATPQRYSFYMLRKISVQNRKQIRRRSWQPKKWRVQEHKYKRWNAMGDEVRAWCVPTWLDFTWLGCGYVKDNAESPTSCKSANTKLIRERLPFAVDINGVHHSHHRRLFINLSDASFARCYGENMLHKAHQ